MKELGYGRGYRYAHNEAEGVAEMSCLPPHLDGRRYYEPTDRGLETKIRDALERARRIRESRDVDESGSRKVNE
jgi:putative ATPase